MNNEQIALIASAIVSNRVTTYDDKIVTDRAEVFLRWLEEKEEESLRWGNKNHETNNISTEYK